VRDARKGQALLEVAAAFVFISFVVVALCPLFLSSRKLAVRALELQQATRLALGLLEEIRAKRWDHWAPYASSVLGPDAGETAGNKATFNDVDDYAGWQETPPQDPLGNALPGTTGYTLQVSVSYLTPALAASSSPTSYKKVTVKALRATKELVRLSTVIANR